MKKKSILILFVFMLFSCSLATARPGNWGHHGMGPGNGFFGTGPANLDLTKDQSTKLQTLKSDYLKEITPLQNQRITLRSELRILWDTDSPSKEKIFAKQREISNIQNQIAAESTAYQLGYRDLLTSEQQSKVNFAGSGMSHGRGGNWHQGGRWQH